MTIKQAKRLYLDVIPNSRESDYGSDEWEDIRKELDRVVSASSDRSASNVIRWWNCWDKNWTATHVARMLRNKFAEML